MVNIFVNEYLGVHDFHSTASAALHRALITGCFGTNSCHENVMSLIWVGFFEGQVVGGGGFSLVLRSQKLLYFDCVTRAQARDSYVKTGRLHLTLTANKSKELCVL